MTNKSQTRVVFVCKSQLNSTIVTKPLDTYITWRAKPFITAAARETKREGDRDREKTREMSTHIDKAKKKQVLLFYCLESEDLARKIASQSELIQLQSINWRFLYIYLYINLYSFPVQLYMYVSFVDL